MLVLALGAGVRAQQVEALAESGTQKLAMSLDGGRVAGLSGGGTITVWTPVSRQLVGRAELALPVEVANNAVAVRS